MNNVKDFFKFYPDLYLEMLGHDELKWHQKIRLRCMSRCYGIYRNSKGYYYWVMRTVHFILYSGKGGSEK